MKSRLSGEKCNQDLHEKNAFKANSILCRPGRGRRADRGDDRGHLQQPVPLSWAMNNVNNVKTKPIIKSKTNTKSSNDKWPLIILNLIPSYFLQNNNLLMTTSKNLKLFSSLMKDLNFTTYFVNDSLVL